MFGKSITAVIVTGLLGVTVTAAPAARPIYPGVEYAARSLEKENQASANYCTISPDGLDKRADDCRSFQCGGLKLQLNEKIGQGGYGSVWSGVAHDDSGDIKVAVKTCARGSRCVHGAETQKTLSGGSSAVAHMYAVCEHNDEFYMVQELLEGEIFDAIHMGEYQGKSALIKKDFGQILDAVDFIRSRGWAHRDLKPENIMRDQDGKVKLIDFDFATQDSESKQGCGTDGYMAPEVLSGEPYDTKADDTWALGVILFEMVLAQSPWQHSDDALAGHMLFADRDRASFMLRDRFPTLSEPLADLFARVFDMEEDRIDIQTFKKEFMEIKWYTTQGARVDLAAPENFRDRAFAVDHGNVDVDGN